MNSQLISNLGFADERVIFTSLRNEKHSLLLSPKKKLKDQMKRQVKLPTLSKLDGKAFIDYKNSLKGKIDELNRNRVFA